MDLGISGKRVLVTGSSKGIGLAIARAFAKEGCKISLLARNERKLKEIIQEIGGTAAGHDYLSVDLRKDNNAPNFAIKKLLKANGYYDIVVHNVGGALGRKDPLSELSDWVDVWHFNVGIAISMNAHLIPLMKQNNWGRIVHISSISGLVGEPREHPYGGALPYAAAKAYLNAYVKGLGLEMAEHNVVVTAIMPGVVLSEGKFWDKLKKSNSDLADNFIKQYYPIGRFGSADEIAPFAVFMASEHASFASGSIVPISGGRV